MDFTLPTALDLNNLPAPNIIGISEFELCDGSFLFGALIDQKVKQNERVVLVLHFNTFGHYLGICTKLGINLLSLQENKQLLVINVMDKFGVRYIDECKDELWIMGLFKETFHQVISFLIENSSPATVFIESPEVIGFCDLLNYCDVAPNYKSWQLTLKYISILSSLKTIGKTSLVFMVKSGKDLRENQVLNSTVNNISDLFVEVRKLETGSAHDIFGSIEITRKGSILEDIKRQSEFHYQLLDRSIKLFAPGTVQFR